MYLKKEDWVGVVIVGAVIVIIAAFFFFAPTASPIAYQPVEETGSALSVAAPTSKTLSDITVDATLKVPGFITFNEAIGQAPGQTVGQSQFLQAGDYHGLVIHLSVPLEMNNQYFGLLFKDDGNKTYDPGVDLPVMSNGQPIKFHFITPEM